MGLTTLAGGWTFDMLAICGICAMRTFLTMDDGAAVGTASGTWMTTDGAMTGMTGFRAGMMLVSEDGFSPLGTQLFELVLKDKQKENIFVCSECLANRQTEHNSLVSSVDHAAYLALPLRKDMTRHDDENGAHRPLRKTTPQSLEGN